MGQLWAGLPAATCVEQASEKGGSALMDAKAVEKVLSVSIIGIGGDGAKRRLSKKGRNPLVV